MDTFFCDRVHATVRVPGPGPGSEHLRPLTVSSRHSHNFGPSGKRLLEMAFPVDGTGPSVYGCTRGIIGCKAISKTARRDEGGKAGRLPKRQGETSGAGWGTSAIIS